MQIRSFVILKRKQLFADRRCFVLFSFHVGSGCYDAGAYSAAVMSAKAVFDMAEMAGFHFNLLDIGGGFPGQDTAKPCFEEVRYANNKEVYHSLVIFLDTI